MVKIAFCDDELSVLNEICVLLDQYRVEHNQEIEYTAFHSTFDLLAVIERGTRFHILFLDVLMPGVNGIEAAEVIRNYDGEVKIIFLTSSSEFAVQSYRVNAFYYQLKPIHPENFFSLMNIILSECKKEQTNGFVIRCKSGIIRIDPRRLEFCEVIHRTLFIHMTSGEVLESAGSMDVFSDQLASFGCFLRPHRSYLVNMDHVKNFTYRAVIMSCLTEIPIPRGKYREVKERYLEYVFQNRQMMK